MDRCTDCRNAAEIMLKTALNTIQIHLSPIMRKQTLWELRKLSTGQPAQSAQADHGRNFSLLADFLHIK